MTPPLVAKHHVASRWGECYYQLSGVTVATRGGVTGVKRAVALDRPFIYSPLVVEIIRGRGFPPVRKRERK